MNGQELFAALGELKVVELEARLKELNGQVAETKLLIKLARARAKGRKGRKAKVTDNGELQEA